MELLLGQRSPVPDVIAYYIAKRALANQASHKGIRLLVVKLFTGLESGEITCNAAVSACQMAKQSGKALVLHLDAADKLDVGMDHVQFSQQCMGEGQTARKAKGAPGRAAAERPVARRDRIQRSLSACERARQLLQAEGAFGCTQGPDARCDHGNVAISACVKAQLPHQTFELRRG